MPIVDFIGIVPSILSATVSQKAKKCNGNCDDGVYDDDDEDDLCDGRMNYANYLVNECHQSSRQNTDNDDNSEKLTA